MYGKLLKYEFKATWKVSVIIYAALAAITAIGCIYMSLPPVKAINTISEYKPNESLIESISVFMGLFYGISLVAAGAGISIYLIVRFYRNMYTDEGYLMHTLPVGWVEPVDISNAVLFLASDESRYITGVPLPIDAGSCLK